jgi:hypothetical protein
VICLLLILGIFGSLSACSSVDSTEFWTGVRASDQAAIRTAARGFTNSPITNWQLWPDRTKPTEVIFYSEDGKIYRAKKVGGKWQIKDITNAIVVLNTNDLTNRSIQPLAVAMRTFDFD